MADSEKLITVVIIHGEKTEIIKNKIRN